MSLMIGRLSRNGNSEHYYIDADDNPPTWAGQGSAHLGLSGLAERSGIDALLTQRHPTIGEPLLRSEAKCSAFDLTFTSPAQGSPIDKEAEAAHDLAVIQALEWLESPVNAARTGPGGRARTPTHGLVAAIFKHRTGRSGEPVLHSHCLIVNCAQATTDGRWRTLNTQALYKSAASAGQVYQSALAA